MGLASDRYFRGQDLYNGMSLQPQAEVAADLGPGELLLDSFFHFSLDQGAQRDIGEPPFDATDPEGHSIKVAKTSPAFNETDLGLGYRLNFDFVQVQAGNRWYLYSKSTERLKDTAEVYAEVSADMLLQPTLFAAYDYDAREGWYYQLDFKQPLPVAVMNGEMEVIPSVSLGFNSGLDSGPNPMYDQSSVVFVDFGLGTKVPIVENLSIKPEVHYVEGVDDFADSDFWFGVAFVGNLGW